MLAGKKILLGITGGIAAYKMAILTRLLIKKGAVVKIIMTPDACNFITPLTLSVLSGNPVNVNLFDKETGEWTNHVHLALWADVFFIAPCTANSLSKFANAQADNLLTTTYLSAKCQVIISPAMDLDMWKNKGVQENISKLKSNGNLIIKPDVGELASGLNGEGRLPEPEMLAKEIEKYFSSLQSLAGKRILITTGPTREYIDAVRYISNASSGKMGFSIANSLAKKGAEITVINGPVDSRLILNNYFSIGVTSADEMFNEFKKHFQNSDIVICAAAVADYKIENPKTEKIKKTELSQNIALVATEDILFFAGRNKKPNQLIIGFALETNNELENAQFKLQKKNADLIILNSLNDQGAGFEKDTNKITFVYPNNKIVPLELMEKSVLGDKIAEEIETLVLKK